MARKAKEEKKEPETKEEALEMLLTSLEKDFGEGAVLTNKSIFPNIERIPSGSFSLDRILNGGYARGRIIEISGPESSSKTTCSLHAIAECQKMGGTCAFIDVEHALDINYAMAIGVNREKLLVCQPESGEQALNIVDRFVRSGIIDLIVVDSVAALVPQSELEGAVGDSKMGLQARMMSQAMRMLVGATAKTNTTIIFINQIRMKIGVFYGCFHYNARVLLEDGTQEKIGKIVNQKLPVKVLTCDKNGKIIPKKIINYYNNGKANKFYQVVIASCCGSGKNNVPVGDDHTFITPNGEKKLSELNIGDSVFIKTNKYLNSSYEMSNLVGTFLGDGSIRQTKNNITSAFRLMHGTNQTDYCKFKMNLFNPDFIGSFGEDSRKRFWWDSKTTEEITFLKKYKKGSALRYVDENLLKYISISSIALWYLDDGTFSGTFSHWGWGKSVIYATKIDRDSKEKLADHFVFLGLPRPVVLERGFQFSGENNKLFQEKICEFVPKCMDYKINPKLRDKCNGDYYTNDIYKSKTIETVISSNILNIYEKPKTKYLSKYDLEIEDNSNYFIDKVLVHNSPEVSPGGEALKFYCSQRLDLRRKEVLADGEDKNGIRVQAKVVKNKVGPPFGLTQFNVMFGKGISYYEDIVTLAEAEGVFKKAGSWYSYGEIKIGQGTAGAACYLEEHPDILEEVKEKLKPKVL